MTRAAWFLAIAAACTLAACGTGSATVTDSASNPPIATSSPTGTPPPAPSPTPTPVEKSYRVDDLPGIVLAESQMVGWQTLSRPDLTGPFTSTSNATSDDLPPPIPSFKAGYRKTLGNPGGAGVTMLGTSLELFDSAAAASAGGWS